MPSEFSRSFHPEIQLKYPNRTLQIIKIVAFPKKALPLIGSLTPVGHRYLLTVKLDLLYVVCELLSAVRNGRRIRFQLPDSSIYTAEANNLQIRNGHVTAQALKSVGPKGSNGFDKKGMWEWLMVSTRGIF